MFRSYIEKNKPLFVLSLIGALQLLLLALIFLFSYLAYLNFKLLQEEEVVKAELRKVDWDFWKYLWNSGKVMSTYSNISRLKGYKSDVFPSLISTLFGGETIDVGSSRDSYESLVNKFWKFNLVLQLASVVASVLGFLVALSLVLIGWHIYHYLLKAQTWNFKKLLMVCLFNIFGFWSAYFWETNLLPDLNISKFLWRIKFVQTNRKLKYKNYTLNLSILKPDEIFLEVKDLNFSHNTNKFQLKKKETITYTLKGINLKIKKGSFNVIVGPNGSGKTTLLKALINLNKVTSGEILWNGYSVSSINPTEFSRQVSYIPQFLNLQNPTPVLDFLEYARYPYRQLINNNPKKDKELVLEAIERNKCQKLKNRMLDELSGGQRQKIVLTSVLVQKSEVIVLDEPTSYLDIKNQHQFLELLSDFHKKGKTVIMVLHDLRQSIKYADNLIVLHEGKVKAVGHPTEIVTNELLKEVFRVSCDIEKRESGIYLNNIYAL